MRARFLRKGEEKQWFDIMGEESSELFTEANDHRFESHVIVEKEDRIVGGLYLFVEEPDYLMLFNPKTKTDGALNPLVGKVIETAKSLNVHKVYSLIHGSNVQFQVIQKVLTDFRFVKVMEKLLYELGAVDLSKTDSDSFLTYRPLNLDNESYFLDIFKTVYQADILEDDAERCFRGLKRAP